MPRWTPRREWEGQDAHLIGGGASLEGFDWSLLEGRNTIGSNAAFRLGAKVVQICIFGDSSWWQKVKWDLEKFKGRVVSCATPLLKLDIPSVLQLDRVRDGLETDGDKIGWNYSTGAAAVNLALRLGASRVFLLGYDMAPVGSQTHWHHFYPGQTAEASFQRFLRGFTLVNRDLRKFPGAQVFNVTDGASRLPVFPRMSVAEWKETLV